MAAPPGQRRGADPKAGPTADAAAKQVRLDATPPRGQNAPATRGDGGRCPVRGCPTSVGRCPWHGRSWPANFNDLDRLVRARPLLSGAR